MWVWFRTGRIEVDIATVSSHIKEEKGIVYNYNENVTVPVFFRFLFSILSAFPRQFPILGVEVMLLIFITDHGPP